VKEADTLVKEIMAMPGKYRAGARLPADKARAVMQQTLSRRSAGDG